MDVKLRDMFRAEQNTEENVWTYMGGNKDREKTA
jgi:hypothetical protein